MFFEKFEIFHFLGHPDAWGTIFEGVRNQPTVIAHVQLRNKATLRVDKPTRKDSSPSSEATHNFKELASIPQQGSLSDLVRQPQLVCEAVLSYCYGYLT